MNTRNVIILFLDNIYQLRSEGSKLNNANDVTRAMWFEEFRVPFPRPGSMFRGNPPQVKVNPIISNNKFFVLFHLLKDQKILKILQLNRAQFLKMVC